MPGAIVIKLYSSSLTVEENKLERLSLCQIFQDTLIFVNTVGVDSLVKSSTKELDGYKRASLFLPPHR